MAYRVGEVLLKTSGCLLLDLAGDLGVASGVRYTLSVFVLHVDRGCEVCLFFGREVEVDVDWNKTLVMGSATNEDATVFIPLDTTRSVSQCVTHAEPSLTLTRRPQPHCLPVTLHIGRHQPIAECERDTVLGDVSVSAARAVPGSTPVKQCCIVITS